VIKNLIKKFIPPFLLDWYHLSLSLLGAILYRFPSRKIKVIGVTGTNGKSTVVYLTTKILEEAGFKVASLSSIKFKIGDKEWQNTLKMTMPGRMKLQKFLHQAVKENCQYAVLEVTSEGIKQHRQRFVDFDVAVFTNLTPEHIESHGSFEKYKEAKGKLFRACKNIHIINIDDPAAEYFLQFPAARKITYQKLEEQFLIKLLGEFNLYNASAAIQVGLSQGIDLATCQRALENIESIPGRMEVVIKEPFRVIVDYAHTPDSLEKVYQAVPSRKICVLGACGGGRDKWKRPELGKIAQKYCDEIILTNEDPYNENPQHILNQIESGFSQIPNSKFQIPKYEKILDRKEAIRRALSLARPGDAVIITGKGSEPWMCIAGGKKIPWDEKGIVLDIFLQRNNIS
jgi:UDP-N-acetylmuramoyl-L-alanyl-D-glutamate--2,6-diaminopimelate ligase